MKINKLKISRIRGVKDIELTPNKGNLVVYGPNGTGKSAVVDAIDFLLTGKISRLSGEGTRRLQLKEHGCHVDSRKKLEDAIVSAEVEIDGTEIKLTRNMKAPSNLKVEPRECSALVEPCLDIASLGTHILSRREILRYITAEAGKRAEEVQSLLNLMEIENLRRTFVSVKGDAEIKFKNANSTLAEEMSEIDKLLSLESFSEEAALTKINEFRRYLKCSDIDELSQEKIRQELPPLIAGYGEKEALNPTQITNYLKELEDILGTKDDMLGEVSKLKNELESVRRETKHKRHLEYRKLLEIGLTLTDESNICPLCGKQWVDENLKAHLEKRKKEVDVTKEKELKIGLASEHIHKKIELLRNCLAHLENAHKQFGIQAIDGKELADYKENLGSWLNAMLGPVETFNEGKWPNSELKDLLGAPFLREKLILPLQHILKEKGAQMSKQKEAWDALTKMEAFVGRYREAFRKKKVADILKRRADKSLEYFENARDSVLEDTYTKIRSKFNQYYKTLHAEDESEFDSRLVPEKAALNFEVDFYKRGMFPPHALHSEGHQDSMGLCLFLALNEHLAQDTLKIIVLDDVIMSIDRSHRRTICGLLKEFFADRQFIITTHDSAWAKQIGTEGLVKGKNTIHFTGWDIDNGPAVEFDKEVWRKIDDDLKNDDVPSAAQKLRRNSEWFFEEVCDRLQARIPYKGNHNWTLGDYMPAAISAYKTYLSSAEKNFRKMGMKEKSDELNTLKENFKVLVTRTNMEQWAINGNVHYRKWGDFSKNDFKPVVEAFENLFHIFECSSCGTPLQITCNRQGQVNGVVCSCRNIAWNVEDY